MNGDKAEPDRTSERSDGADEHYNVHVDETPRIVISPRHVDWNGNRWHGDWVVWAVVVPTLMLLLTGAATFIALLGGKIGLWSVIACAMTLPAVLIDVVMLSVQDALANSARLSTIAIPSTPSSAGPVTAVVRRVGTRRPPPAPAELGRSRFVKRSTSWLSILVVRIVVNSAFAITFEKERAGETWQFQAMACAVLSQVGVEVVIASLMMNAHRDPQPTVWRWWCLNLAAAVVPFVGSCSPYPIIVVVGSFIFLATVTLGPIIVVKVADVQAQRSSVKNGYKSFSASVIWGVPYATLRVARLTLLPVRYRAFDPIFKSFALMFYQLVVMKLIVPIVKYAFGDDRRKLWSFYLPGFLLGFEVGQTMLFLGYSTSSWEFWALVGVQETSSLLRNTGFHLKLYVALFDKVFRTPLPKRTINLMEERRSVIAPADNFGEIFSPLIIIIALAFEATFTACGLEPAPYLAKTGISRTWRTHGDSVMSLGESAATLVVVFALRMVFCWFELTVRSSRMLVEILHPGHARESDPKASSARNLAEVKTATRRASGLQLFDRIVRVVNDDAVRWMQRLAAGMIIMQPLILVAFAAGFGNGQLSAQSNDVEWHS